MALRRQVVDLGRPHLLHQADQVGGVGHVAVMQEEAHALLVGVDIEVVDPAGVEGGGPPLEAVHDVALAEQELGQIGAILAGGAGDQGDLLAHGNGAIRRWNLRFSAPGGAAAARR